MTMAGDVSEPTHVHPNEAATFFLIQLKYEPRLLNPASHPSTTKPTEMQSLTA